MGIANLAFASTAHTSAAAAIMMGTAASGCCIITAIVGIIVANRRLVWDVADGPGWMAVRNVAGCSRL